MQGCVQLHALGEPYVHQWSNASHNYEVTSYCSERDINYCYLFSGDSGFPQRPYLMTPIVRTVAGSPEEHYTKTHCSARNVIERCFGVLKARWRCLLAHRVLHYSPQKAGKIVNACAVLHNIANAHNVPVPSLTDADLQALQRSQQAIVAMADETSIADRRASLVQRLWAARQS